MAAELALPDDMRIALEQSVELQSHYAALLNDYDGGHRMIFPSAAVWVERLRNTGVLEARRRLGFRPVPMLDMLPRQPYTGPWGVIHDGDPLGVHRRDDFKTRGEAEAWIRTQEPNDGR